MPRNVVHFVKRSSALSRRPVYIRSYLNGRHYATDAESQPASEGQLTDEKAAHILRVADQHSLRSTKAQLAKYKSSIEALITASTSVPTHLRSPNPNIRVPYTLAFVRDKVTNTIPTAARETLANIENVRLHLTDLQNEEYKSEVEGNAEMEAFMREIEGWTDDEKELILLTYQREEEATLVRLNNAAKRLEVYVEQVLKGGSGERVLGQKPVFAQGVDNKKAAVGGEAEKAATSASSSKAGPSLQDLNKQMEANITQSGTKKG